MLFTCTVNIDILLLDDRGTCLLFVIQAAISIITTITVLKMANRWEEPCNKSELVADQQRFDDFLIFRGEGSSVSLLSSSSSDVSLIREPSFLMCGSSLMISAMGSSSSEDNSMTEWAWALKNWEDVAGRVCDLNDGIGKHNVGGNGTGAIRPLLDAPQYIGCELLVLEASASSSDDTAHFFFSAAQTWAHSWCKLFHMWKASVVLQILWTLSSPRHLVTDVDFKRTQSPSLSITMCPIWTFVQAQMVSLYSMTWGAPSMGAPSGSRSSRTSAVTMKCGHLKPPWNSNMAGSIPS